MQDFSTLPQLGRYVEQTYSNPHAFNMRRGSKWQHFSTQMFCDGVRRVALGLHSLGVKHGDCVGIVGPASPYWLMIDLGILSAGACSVPMFARLSPENFDFQVADSGMKVLFVVGSQRFRMVEKQLDKFDWVVTFNVAHKEDHKNVMDLDELMRRGEEAVETDPELFSQLQELAQPDDLATIIYTSGSTGVPKGVELTHRNLVSQVHDSRFRFPLNIDKDIAVTALPLAHVFERMVIYFFVATGVSTYFVDDPKSIAKVYQTVRPTIGTVVPRLLEKVASRIQTTVATSKGVAGVIARWAFKLAQSGPITGWRRILLKPIADRLVYRKLRGAMGGRFEQVISGGAPLSPELCQFFWNIGVPVFQGYGLTESSPVLCTNYTGNNRLGTVGKPYPSVELKLGENDEILARGPNIMRGYHNQPEMTAETIDEEGWLHTGDCGQIDSEGYLRITGRIKEIQKTSGGKMVSPVPIEQALCTAPLVDMAMVIAEGRRYVTALLIPDPDELIRKKEELGMKDRDDRDVLADPGVKASVDAVLRSVNKGLSSWEKVRRYRWVAEPLTIEDGDLTPTLKIRRKAVESKYSTLIDTMYDQ